jgi:hypothetical protein
LAAHGFMGAFEALTISSHRLCRWYLTANPSKTLRLGFFGPFPA